MGGAVIWVDLTIVGIATGAVFALAGLGLVLTYKATGVFNFAHGSLAVLAAYLYWQMSGETAGDGWGWPAPVGAVVAVIVVGGGIGFVLETAIFRPLQRSGATTVEKLVATVGAFVLVTGLVVALWTFEVREAPALFSRRPIEVTGTLSVGVDQLMTVVVLAVVCAGLWSLFRFTHLGTEIRAVVDRRELAELASVNADRVSALAWMLGSGLSALTGVLLSAQIVTLNPFGLTLLVIETFSIAVMARLTSLPLAVATGVGLLGVGSSLLTNVSVLGGTGAIGESFDRIKPNLSVVLLFAALLAYRRLDTAADTGVVVSTVEPRRRRARGRRSWLSSAVPITVVGVALALLPLFLDLSGFRRAHQMLALVVIFGSIVAITGFAGQLTLGQAGFAGLGGFASARLANELDLPVIIATIGGGLIAMAAGFLAGWPALRRRGLFLGLTTLAIGLLLSRFVFESPQFAGGVNGLVAERPTLFGWDLSGDTAFYFYELAVAALALVVIRNLRSGRLGRALAAMRESEPGARSIGIDLRAYKLFIFSVSAFIAGIGGALLTQQDGTFQFTQFQPILSLFWFAAVVVAGVGSVWGAVLGAVLYVMLEVVTGVEGLSQFVIGLAALTLGLLPGRSLLGLGRFAVDQARQSWEQFQAHSAARAERVASPPAYEPTPLARRLVGRSQ